MVRHRDFKLVISVSLLVFFDILVIGGVESVFGSVGFRKLLLRLEQSVFVALVAGVEADGQIFRCTPRCDLHGNAAFRPLSIELFSDFGVKHRFDGTLDTRIVKRNTELVCTFAGGYRQRLPHIWSELLV